MPADETSAEPPFPAALTAVLVGLLVAAFLIAVVLAPRGTQSPAERATAPATAVPGSEPPPATTAPATAPPATTAPVATSTTTSTAAGETDEQQITGVAGSFLAAYLTSVTPEERTTVLAGLTTKELAAQLAEVDRLPNTTPLGLSYLNSDGLLATCQYQLVDGTTGVLTLVLTGDGWRVSAITKD